MWICSIKLRPGRTEQLITDCVFQHVLLLVTTAKPVGYVSSGRVRVGFFRRGYQLDEVNNGMGEFDLSVHEHGVKFYQHIDIGAEADMIEFSCEVGVPVSIDVRCEPIVVVGAMLTPASEEALVRIDIVATQIAEMTKRNLSMQALIDRLTAKVNRLERRGSVASNGSRRVRDKEGE